MSKIKPHKVLGWKLINLDQWQPSGGRQMINIQQELEKMDTNALDEGIQSDISRICSLTATNLGDMTANLIGERFESLRELSADNAELLMKRYSGPLSPNDYEEGSDEEDPFYESSIF